MRGGFQPAPSRSWVGLVLAFSGLVVGCEPSSPSAQAGLTYTLPTTWQPAPLTKWAMPGTPISAWSGPHGSSLVVYKALPIPGGTASIVVESLLHRLENLPDLKVISHQVETVGNAEAAHVEVVAPGLGDALAPSGIGKVVAPEGRTLVPTRRVMIGFSRPADTLFLVWHSPESANDAIHEEIKSVLKSLRVESPRAQVSSY